LESHKKHGHLDLDQVNILLYLSPEQDNNKHIQGEELQKGLENQPVLNANVLDYLLVYQELIPESWKDKAVCFWGTIYRDCNYKLAVRCLHLNNKRYSWDYWRFVNFFSFRNPAAVAGK
jgi:hypothetical protein